MKIWDEIQECRKGKGMLNSDTYIQLPRNITKDEVLFLVKKIGNAVCADPMDDIQNSAPSMGEMLDLHDTYGDKIAYHGYAVFPPRSDYRLTLEGYEADGLTLDEFLSIIDEARHADDFNHEQNEDKTFRVYTWWD